MLTDLLAYIIADPGVSALTTSVFPNVLDEGAALPVIVYQVIDAPRAHYQPDGSFDGFNHPRIQFKCWAMTYGEALALSDALKAALEGKVPLPLGSPIITTWIYGVIFDNEMDDSEVYGVRKQYCRSLDCIVLHA